MSKEKEGATKTYFLAFDYWSEKQGFNKFYSGVVHISLDENHLMDIAKKIIADMHPTFDIDDTTIKIKIFNNIEIQSITT